MHCLLYCQLYNLYCHVLPLSYCQVYIALPQAGNGFVATAGVRAFLRDSVDANDAGAASRVRGVARSGYPRYLILIPALFDIAVMCSVAAHLGAWQYLAGVSLCFCMLMGMGLQGAWLRDGHRWLT